MTNLNEIYKCNICGNIVEILHAGAGQLVCCDQPMQLMKENTVDASREKHIPIIEIEGTTIKVKIGSVPHPMEEKHYIELIEVLGSDKILASARLYPGEKPEAEFNLESTEGISARALCNLHGLWKS